MSEISIIGHRNVSISTKKPIIFLKIPRSAEDGHTDDLTLTQIEGFSVSQKESASVNAAYSPSYKDYDDSRASVVSVADFAFCSYDDNSTLAMIASPFPTDSSWYSSSVSSSSIAIYYPECSSVCTVGSSTNCSMEDCSCFFCTGSCSTCDSNSSVKKLCCESSDSITVPGFNRNTLPVKYPWSPKSMDSFTDIYPSSVSNHTDCLSISTISSNKRGCKLVDDPKKCGKKKSGVSPYLRKRHFNELSSKMTTICYYFLLSPKQSRYSFTNI